MGLSVASVFNLEMSIFNFKSECDYPLHCFLDKGIMHRFRSFCLSQKCFWIRMMPCWKPLKPHIFTCTHWTLAGHSSIVYFHLSDLLLFYTLLILYMLHTEIIFFCMRKVWETWWSFYESGANNDNGNLSSLRPCLWYWFFVHCLLLGRQYTARKTYPTTVSKKPPNAQPLVHLATAALMSLLTKEQQVH